MPVITIPALKAYFQNGRQPNETHYIDLIDTLSNPVSVNINMYTDYLTNATWLIGGGTKAINIYTLTQAMFGYSANAKALYGRLYGIGISNTTSVGLTKSNSLTRYPLTISPTTTRYESVFGIWPLVSVGGNFYCRVATATANVQIEVWGEII